MPLLVPRVLVTKRQRPPESTTATMAFPIRGRKILACSRSPAGGLVGVLLQVPARAVGVVEPPLGQRDARSRRALPTPRRTQLAHREGLVRVQVGEQPIQRREAVDQAEGAAHLATSGEALEVPGDVLAELLAA